MTAVGVKTPGSTNLRRFDVALSFPGERRAFVAEVARHLASVFGKDRVLYDQYHEAEFARLDLDVYLPRLYRAEAELIVVFLSSDYAAKRWCGLEWRHIRQLIATSEQQRVMFASFGDLGDLSQLGILAGDGYLDIGTRSAEVIAEAVRERLRLNHGPAVSAIESPACKAEISRIDRCAPELLIGREDDLKLLDNAWDKVRREETPRVHVLTFVALGGEGKTSLVAKWAAGLAAADWPGCEAAFAWSFYSQGTRGQVTASSDLFLREALTFFGDVDTANSALGPHDKGKRLARLVSERKALLILDGLEPLQYAPSSPTPGELKDQGILALLKGLATQSHGLCVVTTRYSIANLNAYRQSTAQEKELLRLSREAGVALLRKLGVQGGLKEFRRLVEDVKGHALTLSLIGKYIFEAHGGDIRRRDLVRLEEADAEEQGGHAFRVMDAYLNWLAPEDGTAELKAKGNRAVAVVRLLGFFDRPASIDCLVALRQPPFIPALTEALAGLDDAQWNLVLARLESAKLLAVRRDHSGTVLYIDAHPLVREYFAQQLRTKHPAAWQAGHERLYEHLCKTTKDKPQPTLEDLQPLYQAVAHGCLAGFHSDVRERVYMGRILRNREGYSTNKLGAVGVDLGALACFFEQPWTIPWPSFSGTDKAWLLNQAAYRLRTLGRLSEALCPLARGLAMSVEQRDWLKAADSASAMSQLQLALGHAALAVEHAEQAVDYADRSGETFQRARKRTALAEALHQLGRRKEAGEWFLEAEQFQARLDPSRPLLRSGWGFRHCMFLVAPVERTAWRQVQGYSGTRRVNRGVISPVPDTTDDFTVDLECCRHVTERARKTLEWAELDPTTSIFEVALNHLTVGIAALYASLLDPYRSRLPIALTNIKAAVDGLRRANVQDHLPRALLGRAWLRYLTGAATGPESAQDDLDEAWEIAERGPMPLFQIDILLYRARLFHAAVPYPWFTGPARGPEDDLADARRLIERHGYWRRKGELEDAEEWMRTCKSAVPSNVRPSQPSSTAFPSAREDMQSSREDLAKTKSEPS